MDNEQLRGLLFEWLLKPDDHRRTIDTCVNQLAHRVKDRFPELLRTDTRPTIYRLTDEVEAALIQLIWDLILSRVLVPADRGGSWSAFSITPYGAEVLRAQQPLPYDPDGYLKRIQAESEGVHPTIIRYLQEALATFRTDNNLASVVMLGCAAEKLFEELSASLPEKLSKEKLAASIKLTVEWCTRNRKQLPVPWNTEEHADDINQIATFIRRRRNDAGHPQDPPAEPNRSQMFSYLMVFPDYCRHVYQLKKWADVQTTNLPQ